MKSACGESGTGEDPIVSFVTKEVELLRRKFAENEKLGFLFQHSSSKTDATVPGNLREGELVLYRKEAEPKSIDDTLSSEYQVLECKDGTNPADKDIQALGVKEVVECFFPVRSTPVRFESDGNLAVVDAVLESDYMETAALKDQSPDTIESNIIKQIILSNETAEEVLLIFETMSIRLVQSHSKFFGKLRKDIIGIQQCIDQTTKFLGDLPPFRSQASRMEFILEVGQHVDTIFCCLADLSRKLIEFHALEMCDIVDDIKDGLKSIVPLDQSPVSVPSVKKAVSFSNVFMLEIAFVAVAAVLFCIVLLLLRDPAVTGAIVEFYANATKF